MAGDFINKLLRVKLKMQSIIFLLKQLVMRVGEILHRRLLSSLLWELSSMCGHSYNMLLIRFNSIITEIEVS